jgi:hypothetical protein
LGRDVQVDARLLPPVEVWSDRDVTLFRQFIAVLANVGVHPEQFLQNNDGGSRQSLRSCDIGGKRAVMPFYRDVIFHCVLLSRQLLFLASAEVVDANFRIGEGPLIYAKSFMPD